MEEYYTKGRFEKGHVPSNKGKHLSALIIRENNINTAEGALACKELWDINNGITLCLECHKQTDTYLKQMKGGKVD